MNTKFSKIWWYFNAIFLSLCGFIAHIAHAAPITINLSETSYLDGKYFTATFTTSGTLATVVGHTEAKLSLYIDVKDNNGAVRSIAIRDNVTASSLAKFLMNKNNNYTFVVSNYEKNLVFGTNNRIRIYDKKNNVVVAESRYFSRKIPIAVNQVGYKKDQFKTAYIFTPQPILTYDAYADYAQGNLWTIAIYKPVQGGRTAVWSREYDDAQLLTALKSTGSKDSATGYYVYEIDFSDYKPEDYQSKLYFEIKDKNGSNLPFGSVKFNVGQTAGILELTRAYTTMASDALRYFYFHRLAWTTEVQYLKDGENYPTAAEREAAAAKHTHTFGNFEVPCFKNLACDEGVTLPAQSAWADAGDFGVYPVNTAAAAWQLMNIIDFNRLASVIVNPRLPVVEYQRVNVNTGSGASAIMQEVLAGTWYMYAIDPAKVRNMPHKFHSQDWSSLDSWDPDMEMDVQPAENDDRDYSQRSATVGSTAASYAACRVLAHASRIMGYDNTNQFPEVKELQKSFLAKAVGWHTEAVTEPLSLYPSSFANVAENTFSIGGGPYGDGDISDDQYACMVELYLAWYQLEIVNGYNPLGAMTKVWRDMVMSHPLFANAEIKNDKDFWSTPLTPANLSLLAASNDLDQFDGGAHLAATKTSLRDIVDLMGRKVLGEEDPFTIETQDTKAEYPAPRSNTTWPWGSNVEALNYVMLLNYYNKFGKRSGLAGTVEHLITKKLSGQTAFEIMNYVLGANIQNKSFVTGYGENAETDTHDRMAWWALDQHGVKYPKGWLAGGPMTDIASCMSGGEVNYSGDSTWERGTPFWKDRNNDVFADGTNDDTDNTRLTDDLIAVHEAHGSIFSTSLGDLAGTDLVKMLSSAVLTSTAYPSFSVSGETRLKPALSYAKPYTAPWSWCSKENAINYNSALVWAAFAAAQGMNVGI